MKNIMRYTLCIAMVATVSGCSQQEVVIKGDALQFLDTGEVSYTICSEFDQDYYDIAELQKMVESEIDDTTTASIELEEGGNEVTLTYLFGSKDAYNDFLGTESYFGSVSDYKGEGYSMLIDLVETKTGDGFVLSDESLEDYTVVCWSDDIQLVVEDKILYTSKNITLRSSKNAIPTEGQNGPYYVLYK